MTQRCGLSILALLLTHTHAAQTGNSRWQADKNGASTGSRRAKCRAYDVVDVANGGGFLVCPCHGKKAPGHVFGFSKKSMPKCAYKTCGQPLCPPSSCKNCCSFMDEGSLYCNQQCRDRSHASPKNDVKKRSLTPSPQVLDGPIERVVAPSAWSLEAPSSRSVSPRRYGSQTPPGTPRTTSPHASPKNVKKRSLTPSPQDGPAATPRSRSSSTDQTRPRSKSLEPPSMPKDKPSYKRDPNKNEITEAFDRNFEDPSSYYKDWKPLHHEILAVDGIYRKYFVGEGEFAGTWCCRPLYDKEMRLLDLKNYPEVVKRHQQ